MKLLFVGYINGFGGAEKMLIALANEMSRRGNEVHLLSLGLNYPCYSIDDSINYYPEEDISQFRLINILNRYVVMRKHINEINPDLIVTFNLQPVYLCSLMGKNITNKMIYAERGDPTDKEYEGILGTIRSYAFKRIRGFVFQTKGARDFFDNSIREKSVVIHNPVFIKKDDFKIPEVRDKRIVTAGRLHKQKNQNLLIDAFAMIAKEFPEYKLEIYGDGDLRNKLTDKIEKLDLSNRIFLMGTHKDIHQRIYNAALFVLSSDYEGMPNALLEALALGMPCISTDCSPGGARELIEDKINGLIVPCGDVKQLADAMRKILSDEELARDYSSKAQAVIEESNPFRIYSRWEEYFKNCMN